MDFMGEEMNFLCIGRDLEREDTLNNVFDAIPDIEDDEMKKLAEVLISKLDIMSEAEFREISFDETFEDKTSALFQGVTY